MKKNLRELFDKATPAELDASADDLDAIDLPPDVLASVKNKVYAKTNIKRKPARSVWLRLGAIAACFAVIVGAVLALPMMWEDGNSTTTESTITEPQVTLPAVPIWDNTLYSADELAKLFGFDKPANTDSTGNYSEVFVSSRDYFKHNLNPIPDSDYMGIYKFNADEKEYNEEELDDFINSFLPKLSESLNEKLLPSKDNSGMRMKHFRSENYEVDVEQRLGYTIVVIYFGYGTKQENFVFDGEELIIDKEKSDAEILESLESIKGKLFDIFDVSFTEAEVVSGIGGPTVRYYDQSLPDLFPTRLFPSENSDYIEIETGINLIGYVKKRGPDSGFYSIVSNERKISLEEAEALLFNGYCFGFHYCPACAKDMEAISFEDYDFVEMKYMFYTSGGDPSIGIPFYVFYKEKGTNGKGGIVYAQTYVPAIEIGGYEEYFRNQEQKHNFNNK